MRWLDRLLGRDTEERRDADMVHLDGDTMTEAELIALLREKGFFLLPDDGVDYTVYEVVEDKPFA